MPRRLTRAVRSLAGPLLRAAVPARPGLPPGTWGLSHEPGRGLCLDGLALHGLLARHGSPLHVVQGARLAAGVATLRRPLPESGRACEVFFSCKTHPVPGVLRLLREAGAGIEVISPYELWLAFQLGFRPEQIVYNGPAKSEASLREAIARGIQLVNVNHREEIPALARLARELGRRPAVGVRVVVPGGWGGQFGIPVAGGEALRAYEEALASGVLDVTAVHAHRGALVRTPAELRAFVDAVLDFTDVLHARLGLVPRILDLGGSLAVPTVAPLDARSRLLNRVAGLPVPPPDPARTLSVADYADTVLRRVERHARARGRPVPRVFVEPGRALTAGAQFLLASVLTVREGGDGRFAILDAGINLLEGVRHEYHQLLPVNRHGEPAARAYALAGPICSPADVLYPSVQLPALRPGDSLAIMDTGAYFVPFATSFSFPQPAIVVVHDGRDSVLRRAESFEDLVALDEPSPSTHDAPAVVPLRAS